jgi:uncharacterized membrane protein
MFGPFAILFVMVHTLSVAMVALGMLCLMTWAWKEWKPSQFKMAGMWMLCIGIVLALLTMAGGGFMHSDMPGMKGKGMMRGMDMDDMMEFGDEEEADLDIDAASEVKVP